MIPETVKRVCKASVDESKADTGNEWEFEFFKQLVGNSLLFLIVVLVAMLLPDVSLSGWYTLGIVGIMALYMCLTTGGTWVYADEAWSREFERDDIE